MKKVITLTMLVAVVALASVAQADLTVDTSDGTGADATVRRNYATNYGTDDTMTARNITNNYCRMAYVRFDLSDLDFTVTEATLTIERVGATSDEWRNDIRIYALNENTSYGTGKLGEDWGETSINGNNAPGADNAEANFIDLDYVTLLGVIQDAVTIPDTASLTFNTNLGCFNSDTNDMVTLIITGPLQSADPYTYYTYMATKENATVAAPKLTLVPEPATMTLLLLGLPLALRRRRR